MLVIAVTHPDATNRSPRPLSDGGRLQALLAARRVRELEGGGTCLGAALSSPAYRCLETAILVARELDATASAKGPFAGDIREVAELKAGRADLDAALGALETETIGGDQAVLLSVHADLANMLGHARALADGFASESNGRLWFADRPVIAGFTYAAGAVTAVRYCETLRGGCWVSCLSPA